MVFSFIVYNNMYALNDNSFSTTKILDKLLSILDRQEEQPFVRRKIQLENSRYRKSNIDISDQHHNLSY